MLDRFAGHHTAAAALPYEFGETGNDACAAGARGDGGWERNFCSSRVL
jgi:hypothetical protein